MSLMPLKIVTLLVAILTVIVVTACSSVNQPGRSPDLSGNSGSSADVAAGAPGQDTGSNEFSIEGHEAGEGPMLAADLGEHTDIINDGKGCAGAAPIKAYDIEAIQVTMVLNRWGDRDPEAYMFAMADQVEAIRRQEAMADDEGRNFGLSLGLGDDAIQPLTLRANVGDCVRVRLTNQTTHPVSLHVHGFTSLLTKSGQAALSTNPDAIALPGDAVEYLLYVDPSFYSENTYYFHPHGAKTRYLVSHGLFGALVVEPAGSDYFDQRTGRSLCVESVDDNTSTVTRCRNSWDAMISPGDGTADFREFVMFYHEIGNAKFTAFDADGEANPIIDPITKSYKPNGRAINYRSESFWRRMGTMLDAVGVADESQAYGSYTFGDPAMPIPQSYLGDPVKIRLVHGGSETMHVPHLHGGGIQWQRQPDVGKHDDPDYTPIDAGLKKVFSNRMPSSGNDSQTIGPSETYELEIGCGSGGCQQTVGDFLFHCHVASHYISGMWHFWRVYNTLQDGPNSTDDLAVVAELPDREGDVLPAVTSTGLVGKTMDFAGSQIYVNDSGLEFIVESQLPPRGVPNHVLDAAVWDWSRDGEAYFGEPETTLEWPNFKSENPGDRPELMFDQRTGKLAFPFLRPHLGQRPPFAPNNGPAPYLEPIGHNRGRPAAPGKNGPDSLCPKGAPLRFYKIHAIQTAIQVAPDAVDANGMIFVVKENEERARNDPEYKTPLAIRANQGDCVDVMLVNELEETGDPGELSKTNIHIHFVQFDTQASDGVISGASYEQSPRPFADPGMSAAMTSGSVVGANVLMVDDTSSFHVGSIIAVGIDQMPNVTETARIAEIEEDRLILEQSLRNSHKTGELITVEFVRYRWYVARQNGAIYFHDHVDALERWGHGLFGALIAEPTGSTWHHPETGEPLLSGTEADIRVDNDFQVLPGLLGSFREFVLFMNDNNPLTGSSFNLRAEPLQPETKRGQGPPQYALSSVMYGDPFTPVLNAYAGDPIMLRLLTSATEEIHPFHITGHRFRQERFREDSPEITVFGTGISERFNAYIPSAGGPSALAGDYLYYNGADRHFIEGAWGILRVHGSEQPYLKPLPGRQPPLNSEDASLKPAGTYTYTGLAPDRAESAGEPCPADAPNREFRISAIQTPLIFNQEAGLGIPNGRMYALDSDVSAIRSGAKRARPLAIRANHGDCITIIFTNRMEGQPASMQVDGVSIDPRGSLGITLGMNPDQTVLPGGTTTYKYYADKELGVVQIRDFGNIYSNARNGLYGALVIEPEGSTYVDPDTGAPVINGLEAIIKTPREPDFREFVTIFQDNDPDIGLFIMPYDEEVNRIVGVNYGAEPLSLRLAGFDVVLDAEPVPDAYMEQSRYIFSQDTFGAPATGVFRAYAGDPVRFRVVSGYSEQTQVFSIEGHEWKMTPEIAGSDAMSSRYLPPTGVLNVRLQQAGGPQGLVGDYIWGNHRLPYEKAGQWGFLSVVEPQSLSPLGDK